MMISGVGVSVAGTKDCLVGTKVAVTKSGPTVVTEFESTATEMQEVKSNAMKGIIFLSMETLGPKGAVFIN
jgi:hypothetical protein